MAERRKRYTSQRLSYMLRLAVLFGAEVLKICAMGYSVLINIALLTLTNERYPEKINISCHFDPNMPIILTLGLKRKLFFEEPGEQALLEARTDTHGGQARLQLADLGPAGPDVWEPYGSVQQRWLSLVRTNLTSADDGEYSCYALYQTALDQPLLSVSASVDFTLQEGVLKPSVAPSNSSDVWWRIMEATLILFSCALGLLTIGALIKRYCRRRSADNEEMRLTVEDVDASAEARYVDSSPAAATAAAASRRESGAKRPSGASRVGVHSPFPVELSSLPHYSGEISTEL